MNRLCRSALAALTLGLVFVGSAGAATNIPPAPGQSGVYQGSTIVPGVGEGCTPVTVQITYDSNTHTVGFQHGGAATNKTVTGTSQASSGHGTTGTVNYPNGSTGVGPTPTGAGGVALPIQVAKGLAGGSLPATSTGTITYSFVIGDCTYTLVLTVNFDSSGNVQSVSSNP